MFEAIVGSGVLNGNEKDTFTPQADTDQRLLSYLTDIAMQAQSISWRINIDNCGLGIQHAIEEAANQIANICWELRSRLWRVNFIRPIILASKSHPTHFLLEYLLHVKCFVKVRIFRLEEDIGWGGGEKGVGMIWIGDVVVKMEIGLMFVIGEVAM